MQWSAWFSENWSNLLQTVGVMGSLIYTAKAFRLQTKVQAVESCFHQTQRHAEILRELTSRPELARIRSPEANLTEKPLTDEESTFVQQMVAHLYSSYFAIKTGVLEKPEALDADIKTFFSLPVPRSVWEKIAKFQNRDFREFVDNARK